LLFGGSAPTGYAPPGFKRRTNGDFLRSNYFEHVGNEALRLRKHAGVIDLTPFTKARSDGTGRGELADGLVANKGRPRSGG